jgi:pimeloyl-ACP methyl ester carboxylesterase
MPDPPPAAPGLEPTVDAAAGAGFPAGTLRLGYVSPVDGHADWALLLPPSTGATWLVALHGHGSGGDQLFTRPDIRAAWLAHYCRRGLGVLSPHLRGNAWMSPAAVADLHALLAWLRQHWGAGRVILYSGSMGGTGNLIYAVQHPEDVRAVAALGAATDLAAYWHWCREQRLGLTDEIALAIAQAYGGAPSQAPAAYAAHQVVAGAHRLSMPVLLAHGGADALIPVHQARALAARLDGQAGFVYREVPDGDHDAPLHGAGGLAWLDAQL